MNIKDMKHVTVEQVLALRDGAIKIERQRDQLAEALRELEKEFPVPACKEELEAVEQARAALEALEDE